MLFIFEAKNANFIEMSTTHVDVIVI